MGTRRHQYRKPSERGVTTVEGAIIIVMFFMLIFGVVEMGWFLKTRQALTNAAREGARFAVAPASGTNNLPTTAEITTKVDTFLAAGGITGATVTVTRPILVPTGPDIQTSYTKVLVTKPYQVIATPLFNALQITLKGEALMRNETSE